MLAMARGSEGRPAISGYHFFPDDIFTFAIPETGPGGESRTMMRLPMPVNTPRSQTNRAKTTPELAHSCSVCHRVDGPGCLRRPPPASDREPGLRVRPNRPLRRALTAGSTIVAAGSRFCHRRRSGRLRVRAADAWLLAGDEKLAKDNLRWVEKSELTPADAARLNLVLADFALRARRPEEAESLLREASAELPASRGRGFSSTELSEDAAPMLALPGARDIRAVIEKFEDHHGLSPRGSSGLA